MKKKIILSNIKTNIWLCVGKIPEPFFGEINTVYHYGFIVDETQDNSYKEQ